MPAVVNIDHRLPGGLSVLGSLAWGDHVCQLYRHRDDLAEALVPFVTAGLLANERCVCIAAAPLPADEARAAIAAVVPGLEERERAGQIHFRDASQWYLGPGEPRQDGLLEAWLALEAEALQAGYAGLRIAANATSLERHLEHAFAGCKARAHAALRGRRIVALCSYPLARCEAASLIDVLRHHSCTLVPRRDGWEAAQAAPPLLADALAADEPAAERHEEAHLVQFFDDDFTPDSIAGFLAAGLAAGEGAVVVATPPHTAAVSAALLARGVDVAALQAAGSLRMLDAVETLGALCPGGRLVGARLREHLGPLLEDMTAGHPRVRAYGEMVDLLAGKGRIVEALALEQAWNALLLAFPIQLLCGYHLSAFDHQPDSGAILEVCAAHSQVLTPERGAGAVPPVAGGALSAELRHKGRSARLATERLVRLQSITAALAEAASSAAVAHVVLGEVAHAVGAQRATLAVVDAKGGLRRLGCAAVALPSEGENAGHGGSLEGTLAEAFRCGEALWLTGRSSGQGGDEGGAGALAALPLAIGGHRLGAIAFAFAADRPFATADRALFEDLARQVAIALDRARLYEEANHARESAENASRAKDEFLAMLGHELRNPLSPIVTTLHLMKLRAGGQLERERSLIERQVQHLLRLVEDLLDVSRITRGKVLLDNASVEIAEVVAQAIETVGPLLEQRSHRLVVEVPPQGLLVHGDAARLAQVIANLLTNAAKYTPTGGRLEILGDSEQGGAVVRVRDSGIGIAPELLPTIFDTFVQGPRARDRAEGGLGLGLSIARSLVQLHGGSIEAHSGGLGQGAEFVVRLPLARGLRWATRPGEGVEAATAARCGGHRVLIVDDNVDAASMLAELLATMGCAIRVAHDGPAALLAAQELVPELILLDIGLPVMDGYEVAARLRERPALAATRIVALSGYGQPSDRERSRRAGCDEHLVKPISADRLAGLLALLESTPGAGAALA